MKSKKELVKAYRNMFGTLSGPVFNGHVNDADKRARRLMEVISPEWLAEVKKKEKAGGGIMAIFQADPTLATMAYAVLVNAFVLEA